MKLIINVFYDEKLIAVPERVINFFRADECYYIFDKKKPKVKIKNLHLLKRDDVFWKADYGVEWDDLIPLDEKIIRQMAACEVVVLKMMDRYEFDKPLTYSERKRIYLKHLRFWNNVFETKKIDLFLAANIPHEVYDYIIYSLCKIKKVPTLFLYHQTQIKDCVLLLEDQENFCPELKTEYEKLLKQYLKKKNSEVKLSKRFEEEYEVQRAKANKTPFWINSLVNFRKSTVIGYMANLFTKVRTNPRAFFSLILKTSYWENRILKIFKKKNFQKVEKELFVFYDKNANEPNFSTKYIYFPLQYQPELSTSPLGGSYVDQLLIAQMISKFLPGDVKIYVKEHPMQRLIGRDKNFYQDLLETKNVELIKRSYDSFKLVENCLAVTTCTGTPGWEALFRNKWVLMFGDYFYEYATGVFRIKSLEDCERAVSYILKNKQKKSENYLNNLRIFLKAYENISIRGFVDPFYKSVSEVAPRENVRNIGDAIITKIKSILKK